MNWNFLTWLLPWRAKQEIERLRNLPRNIEELKQAREQLHDALQSLERISAEARIHEHHKNGLLRFILVSQRMHVPPRPGSIREQLLKP